MLKRLLHKSCVWIMVTLLVLTNIDWTVYAVEQKPVRATTYSIKGKIFDDLNKNATQDRNEKAEKDEKGISGIEVRVIGQGKTYKTVTKSDGSYLITVGSAGTYEINLYADSSKVYAYNLDGTIEKNPKFEIGGKGKGFLRIASYKVSGSHSLNLGIIRKRLIVRYDNIRTADDKRIKLVYNYKNKQEVGGSYAGYNMTYFVNSATNIKQYLYCLQPDVSINNEQLVYCDGRDLNSVYSKDDALL